MVLCKEWEEDACAIVNNNNDENNNKFFGIGGVNGQKNLEGGGAASRWYAANGGPARRKMCSQGRTCPNINDMNKCQFSHDVVHRPCRDGENCKKNEKCLFLHGVSNNSVKNNTQRKPEMSMWLWKPKNGGGRA